MTERRFDQLERRLMVIHLVHRGADIACERLMSTMRSALRASHAGSKPEALMHDPVEFAIEFADDLMETIREPCLAVAPAWMVDFEGCAFESAAKKHRAVSGCCSCGV